MLSGAGLQSTSDVHGEQYVRGRHTLRVLPKVAVFVVALGAWLTVAHDQPPGQSVSFVQSNLVQNALASVGLSA